jgi:hypothetical protein
MKVRLIAAIFAGSAVLMSQAQAATFNPGYSTVGTPNAAVYIFKGTGADVVATFVGASAADTDILEMSVNGGAYTISTLNNQTSHSGDTYNFGIVAAGSTLTFAILNQSTGSTLSSNAGLNADGAQHVWSFNYTQGTLGFSSINSGIALAFEDLLGGSQNSDFDYNDFDAVITGIIDPTPTPLPATLPLFAGGLGFVGYLAKRRKHNKKQAVAVA